MSPRPRRHRRAYPATWTAPALIAVASLVGLLSALTGDGARDALSWAALAMPVAATGWAMRARRC